MSFCADVRHNYGDFQIKTSPTSWLNLESTTSPFDDVYVHV